VSCVIVRAVYLPAATLTLAARVEETWGEYRVIVRGRESHMRRAASRAVFFEEMTT